MKVEVSKEKLIEALIPTERISGKNLTLSVLNCVFLSVKKNTLTITSTNLDLGIKISIPAKVKEEGEIAVSGNTLLQTVLNIFNTNSLNLEVVGGNLQVSYQKGTSLIKSTPHDDFPTIPTVKGENSFTLPVEGFLQGIKSVWYSSSTSAIKPELSSVYIYPEGNKLFFVATDSFRLAEKVITTKDTYNFEPLLIPFRNIADIVRVFEEVDSEVHITCDKNQIGFVFDGVYVTSRLIDGMFPDYKQIVPKEYTTELVLLKEDAINTLKKTGVFSDKFNQVRFHIHLKQKKFSLHAQNADVGETTDEITATISGENLDISFNQKYITDCFQSIHSDSVSFSFSGLGKPVVIRGVSDPSFFYLVMPMNK